MATRVVRVGRCLLAVFVGVLAACGGATRQTTTSLGASPATAPDAGGARDVGRAPVQRVRIIVDPSWYALSIDGVPRTVPFDGRFVAGQTFHVFIDSGPHSDYEDGADDFVVPSTCAGARGCVLRLHMDRGRTSDIGPEPLDGVIMLEE